MSSAAGSAMAAMIPMRLGAGRRPSRGIGFRRPPMAAAGGHQLEWSGRSWSAYSGTGALGQRWSPDHVRVGAKGTLVQTVAGGLAGAIGDPTPYLYGHGACASG